MKNMVFMLCIALTISNCIVALWLNNATLAAAWGCAIMGWVNALLASLAGGQE